MEGKGNTHVDGLDGARPERGVHSAHEAGHDDEQLRQAREVVVALVVVLVAPRPQRRLSDRLPASSVHKLSSRNRRRRG